jgi:hypothetical protein
MRIAARFNGPPGSANGGITAGRLAAYVGAPVVEVTLRRPPPLGVDLRVEASGGSARLLDGDLLVAEAVPCTDELDAGEPVDVAARPRRGRVVPRAGGSPLPDLLRLRTEPPGRDAGLRWAGGRGPVGGRVDAG